MNIICTGDVKISGKSRVNRGNDPSNMVIFASSIKKVKSKHHRWDWAGSHHAKPHGNDDDSDEDDDHDKGKGKNKDKDDDKNKDEKDKKKR